MQVRDKEGAQQDMIDHGTAYKRRSLQVCGIRSFPFNCDVQRRDHSPLVVSGGVPDAPCMQAALEGKSSATPFGSLIFTCNGRGRGLYGEPHWDSRAVASFVPVPSIGFFCNGEIGQVGKSTYLHGFTCVAAILCSVPPEQ